LKGKSGDDYERHLEADTDLPHRLNHAVREFIFMFVGEEHESGRTPIGLRARQGRRCRISARQEKRRACSRGMDRQRHLSGRDFGYAPKGVSSRAVRENVSLDMARRYAKSRIGQGLWGYLCEINAACDDYIYPCCSGPNTKNAIAEAAASGSVILVRYDSDSNCGIIVRAVQTNLKDRIGGYHEK
jgi:hypothetical protein